MDFTLFRNRLNTVDREIGDGQTELAHVDLQKRQCLLKVGLNPCIFHLCIRAQKPNNRIQNVVDLNRFKFQGRETIEIEKILQVRLPPKRLITDETEKGENLLLLGEVCLFHQ